MDDLSQKIEQLLSSPDSMKQIESLMSSFGSPPSSAQPSSPTPDLSALLPSGGDMDMLLKMTDMVSKLSQPDHTSDLLNALRPHLKNDRQKRLDEAARFLKIAKLLPLLNAGGKGESDP